MKYDYYEFLRLNGFTKEAWDKHHGLHQAIDEETFWKRERSPWEREEEPCRTVIRGFYDRDEQILYSLKKKVEEGEISEDFLKEKSSGFDLYRSEPKKGKLYACDVDNDFKAVGLEALYFVCAEKYINLDGQPKDDIYVFDNVDEANEYLNSLEYDMTPPIEIEIERLQDQLPKKAQLYVDYSIECNIHDGRHIRYKIKNEDESILIIGKTFDLAEKVDGKPELIQRALSASEALKQSLNGWEIKKIIWASYGCTNECFYFQVVLKKGGYTSEAIHLFREDDIWSADALDYLYEWIDWEKLNTAYKQFQNKSKNKPRNREV